MVLGILQESLFAISIFFIALVFAMLRGTQAILNLILGLYIALLISLKFPYYGTFMSADDSGNHALLMIVIFVIFTVAGMLVFGRLMRTDGPESAFEFFGKKAIFALLATILLLAFSYHALPVTDLITPGSPIQALFAPESHFFWWLILPLVALFFLL